MVGRGRVSPWVITISMEDLKFRGRLRFGMCGNSLPCFICNQPLTPVTHQVGRHRQTIRRSRSRLSTINVEMYHQFCCTPESPVTLSVSKHTNINPSLCLETRIMRAKHRHQTPTITRHYHSHQFPEIPCHAIWNTDPINRRSFVSVACNEALSFSQCIINFCRELSSHNRLHSIDDETKRCQTWTVRNRHHARKTPCWQPPTSRGMPMNEEKTDATFERIGTEP